MSEFQDIKTAVAEMSKKALSMWELAYQAFMEHEEALIARALEEEDKINQAEKDITADIIALARSPAGDKLRSKLSFYTDIVQDLELIGDYCKDILERVQIKIEEKLLFSEDGVREYSELYNQTKQALEEVTFALDKDNPALIKEAFRQQGHIDSLVNEYRRRHNERLLSGLCMPLACNMFLNMLDFNAAVYYHAKKIAANLIKLAEA